MPENGDVDGEDGAPSVTDDDTTDDDTTDDDTTDDDTTADGGNPSVAVEQRYGRLVETVWRLAPDRVLVRRVWPKDDEDEAADLLGVAALIWVALDEPATMAELDDRLTDADQVIPPDDVRETLASLLATGWIRIDEPV